MKNVEFWNQFIQTGNIKDYLNYSACTSEESTSGVSLNVERKKEGGFCVGTNYRSGNGSVGHADW